MSLATEIRRLSRIRYAAVHDDNGRSGHWCWLRPLDGGDDACDIVIFASNDDRLLAVSPLQSQEAAVLNAAPANGHDEREDCEAKDHCY
jgi:hypothetical protein